MYPHDSYQLWMGNLEPYMTEEFIGSAFRSLNEKVLSVRIIRDKKTGAIAGYGFVRFETYGRALTAMHRLNGKPIPGTRPIVRFKLNFPVNNNSNPFSKEKNYSVFVGELSSDVDNYQLYYAFSSLYPSIMYANVIYNSSGFSRGFGFVRFSSEAEQRLAAEQMNGFNGLGLKTIKVSIASWKYNSHMKECEYPAQVTQTENTTLNYSTSNYYYNNYEQDHSYDYNNMYNSYEMNDVNAYQYEEPYTENNVTYEPECPPGEECNSNEITVHNSEAGEEDLVDYRSEINVDELNQETMNQDNQFYDALETSKWSTDTYIDFDSLLD
ncbi:tRNA selenocysteine 1-associated protein 1-like [Teleopsis dalmanni]|uniref:tRNA selenocysteine 1-associated protein 1-like n=1 Tax=Teleopsis dalmanni TaxID=139649 RepID=UPI0018CE26C7|nr:tRNA selenocysteine 1-associated protein 1-like [Teleopsis dalmanni]